ncbi:PEP-CTERM sorting domain-containing protein [Uliginosibacterium sp. H3]|uniref:PEP-CTERM sorting domain-containing protein n=1 Tax=Uliginosibacterium silvisoli TaxID=3114758 RepID=A0ABU6KAQ3_9RHOO|nr:PEP-CTERM sorting domain-containing protein [Uliginosibacterium sp. H3]
MIHMKKMVAAVAIAAASVGAAQADTYVSNFEFGLLADGGLLKSNDNNPLFMETLATDPFIWTGPSSNGIQVWDDVAMEAKVPGNAIVANLLNGGTVTNSVYGSFMGLVKNAGVTASFSLDTAVTGGSKYFSLDSITTIAGKTNGNATAGQNAVITLWKDGVQVGSWSNTVIGTATTIAVGDAWTVTSLAGIEADTVKIYSIKGQQFFDNIQVTAVPEASTYAMLLAGLGMIGVIARRRTKA